MPSSRKEAKRTPDAIQLINNLHQYVPLIFGGRSKKRPWKPLRFLNSVHLWLPSWGRKLRRRWKLVLCVLVLMGAALACGIPYYRNFKRDRLIAHANSELGLGHAREAAIFALDVLRADPNNLAACKLIAKALSDNWPQDALLWYRRVDQLRPGGVENGLGWARTAFKVNQTAEAQVALGSIAGSGANVPEYHWLMAKAAFANGDMEKAEADLAKACALAPDDTGYGLDLARIRLLLPGEKRTLGLAALGKALAEPVTRLEALQILVQDAAKQGPPDKALEYVKQLEAEPGANQEDRLTCLGYLLRVNDPTFASELRRYEAETLRDADLVAGLIFWMSENNLSILALEWAADLPRKITSSQKVPLAMAQAYVTLGDWDRLKALAAGGDWKSLDFLRAAMLARAQREQGNTLDADDKWKLAVLKAEDHPEALVVLCKMAEGWGWRWNSEAEDLAWKVSEQPHPPESVLRLMLNRFVARGDTQKLYRLTLRLREIDPTDRVSQNDFSLVSLLLKENLQEAQQEAERLYDINPADYQTASTYAFSLYLRGRTDQALAILRRFQDKLRDPSVAAYYGIILAGAGQRDEAGKYIRIAKRATLLPEERALLRDAETK